MKNRKWLIGSLLVLFVAVTGVKCLNTDLWELSGLGAGIFYNKDVARVDKDGNFRLYSGNLVLGDSGTQPSTSQLATTTGGVVSTVNGYSGLKVQFYNGSGVSTAIGSIITSSVTATTIQGTMVTALATTTVVGISDGVYPTNTVGYMTIDGYALCLTTGTVFPGDLIVSTDTTQGYGGKATGTVVVGSVIAKAVGKGTTSGGLTAVIVNRQ